MIKIKVVPNNNPNGSGRWIDVDTNPPGQMGGWIAAAEYLKPFVPADHHLVGYETMRVTVGPYTITRDDGGMVMATTENATVRCDNVVYTLAQEIERLRENEDRLRALLLPFAEASQSLDEKHKDSDHIWESPAAMEITAGQLRSACDD